MVQAPTVGRRQKLLAGGLFSAMVLSALWQRQVADADVSEVIGSAYGHRASVSLFGGDQPELGPDPTVTLPPGGGDETASAPSVSAIFGPATIFTSGPLTVTTEGTTGPDGSVTSNATIEEINRSEQEVFTADNLASTCTASEGGVSGSVTVTNGTLQTSEGNPDVEGDEVIVEIPANPAPNTTYEGTIETVGDNFRYVFNEQIENADGTITVNAAHQYLLGPTAVGELVVGQVVCGVGTVADEPGDGDTTTTTAAQPGGSGQATTTTTTTQAGQQSTTTVAPSRPAPTTPAQPSFTG